MSLKQNNNQPRQEGLCNSIKEMKENLNIYNGSDVTLLKVKWKKYLSLFLPCCIIKRQQKLRWVTLHIIVFTNHVP